MHRQSGSEPLRILSLGAGVQSSCIALMSAAGELPMMDAAIFADTQNEPPAVMRYLEMLDARLPFPVYRVTAGNLAEDFLAAARGEKNRCGQPPFYVKQPDEKAAAAGRPPDDRGGMLWRQCTKDYKITPIQRKVRELIAVSGAKTVLQYIGISLDEAHRMKHSGVKYITNIYPLIDLRMSRWDCLRWIAKAGLPEPPKSACWHCPYRSNAQWRTMKITDPESWQAAVNFDNAARAAKAVKINGSGITGEVFVWRGMKPLEDADLTNDIDNGQGEIDFGNECEGMCGV